MGFAKRIFLFAAVNILIILTVTVIMSVFGVRPYMTERGLDYEQLFIFCLIWGMAGSFISLGLSRIMAKWMMKVQLITDSAQDPTLRWVRDTVKRHCERAGLKSMPEVGVYESPEINAFATGPTKARSLVALSSGLLRQMNQDEAEGVIAHEVAHIANGDMVTLTLIQGVVNAFVMFFARIIAYAITANMRGSSRMMVHLFVVIALQIVLGIFGSMVVAAFSRHREFRADDGGARLAGREKMIAALEHLAARYNTVRKEEHESIAAFKISNRRSGFMQLLSTHPPLEQRIEALKRGGGA